MKIILTDTASHPDKLALTKENVSKLSNRERALILLAACQLHPQEGISNIDYLAYSLDSKNNTVTISYSPEDGEFPQFDILLVKELLERLDLDLGHYHDVAKLSSTLLSKFTANIESYLSDIHDMKDIEVENNLTSNDIAPPQTFTVQFCALCLQDKPQVPQSLPELDSDSPQNRTSAVPVRA